MSSFYKDFCVLRASVEKGVGKLTSLIRASVLGGTWDSLLLFGGKYEDCSTLDDFSELELPLFHLAVACFSECFLSAHLSPLWSLDLCSLVSLHLPVRTRASSPRLEPTL